jgi:hypothetical protein
MESLALGKLLNNNRVITENEKIRLLQFFEKTTNIDEQDLKKVETDSLLFVMQAYSSGSNRAEKLWDMLLDRIQNYDERIFDATKVLLVYKYSPNYPLLVKEQCLIFERFLQILNSEIKLAKMSWIIDENLGDDLELTLILGSPITNVLK